MNLFPITLTGTGTKSWLHSRLGMLRGIQQCDELSLVMEGTISGPGIRTSRANPSHLVVHHFPIRTCELIFLWLRFIPESPRFLVAKGRVSFVYFLFAHRTDVTQSNFTGIRSQ